MNILRLDISAPAPLLSGTAHAATVGFFDGVHRGHQYLIEQVKTEARLRQLQSMLITFDRHPRQVLSADYQPQLLSTTDEKLRLLSQTGVDTCVVLHFDRLLASLSAQEFMQLVLRDRFNVRTLVTGYDNRFGHRRSEGFADYVRYGRPLSIDVVAAQAFVLEGVHISSSVVRSFVSEGEVEMAARALGHPYAVEGTVVHGERVGHQLGFPTANVGHVDSLKLLPAPGVYAVKVRLEGHGELLPAMLNIGHRPTFGHHDQLTIEAHIFHLSGDLYGQHLQLYFFRRLRPEQRFDSRQALVCQLHRDAEAVRQLLC